MSEKRATPGNKVIDLTAKRNSWPDDEGVIVEVDGSNILVEYHSKARRWKRADHLMIVQDDTTTSKGYIYQ